ncbi:hypothetical protein [Zobellella sp. An-6]|uniref:hypothetical protein n=1 Tax=Zobellella sp. An-6 TaxID=3400218 RepID=UPI004042E881
MAKKIIFIHGRAQKPSKQALRDLWFKAVAHGLERDFGVKGRKLFDGVAKDFVYYGDLSNAFLDVPEEDPKSRYDALETLKSYSKSQFSKSTYKRVSRAGFLKEALADTFSAALGKLHLAESLITSVAPDMAHYWNEESYFGSDVRNRLTPVLRSAFDNEDDLLLVSHSLGTMISFDNLWKFSHYGEYRQEYGASKKVDLFVTLGSPLGDENVRARLKGSSNKGFRKYPTNIKRWCNIAAEDDYISHDSKIRNDYKEMLKLGILGGGLKDIYPIYNLNVRNGKSNPHSSIGYLIHPKFSELVHEWLGT